MLEIKFKFDITFLKLAYDITFLKLAKIRN